MTETGIIRKHIEYGYIRPETARIDKIARDAKMSSSAVSEIIRKAVNDGSYHREQELIFNQKNQFKRFK